MALHINESEVQKLFTMPLAIEAVEKISKRQAAGAHSLSGSADRALQAAGKPQ